MTRQWALNLSLLLAVLVLVGIAFFQPGLVKKKSLPPLTDIDTGHVQQIVIERPSHNTVQLNKGDQQWMLSEPIHARASEFVVSNILAIAGIASHNRLPYAAAREAAKYGFDKPRAVVHFDKESILFGDTSPLNHQQYVLYHDQVQMISGNALWALTRKYTEYLDKRLLEFKEPPTAIRFDNGSRLELKNGSWVLRPEMKSLSTDALTQLVNEWRNVGATQVEPYAGAPLLGKIRIVYATHTVELGIVSRQPELILLRKDEKLQYYFPASIAPRLLLRKK